MILLTDCDIVGRAGEEQQSITVVVAAGHDQHPGGTGQDSSPEDRGGQGGCFSQQGSSFQDEVCLGCLGRVGGGKEGIWRYIYDPEIRLKAMFNNVSTLKNLSCKAIRAISVCEKMENLSPEIFAL